MKINYNFSNQTLINFPYSTIFFYILIILFNIVLKDTSMFGDELAIYFRLIIGALIFSLLVSFIEYLTTKHFKLLKNPNELGDFLNFYKSDYDLHRSYYTIKYLISYGRIANFIFSFFTILLLSLFFYNLIVGLYIIILGSSAELTEIFDELQPFLKEMDISNSNFGKHLEKFSLGLPVLVSVFSYFFSYYFPTNIKLSSNLIKAINNYNNYKTMTDKKENITTKD